MVHNGKSESKLDDLGQPYFRKPPHMAANQQKTLGGLLTYPPKCAWCVVSRSVFLGFEIPVGQTLYHSGEPFPGSKVQSWAAFFGIAPLNLPIVFRVICFPQSSGQNKNPPGLSCYPSEFSTYTYIEIYIIVVEKL